MLIMLPSIPSSGVYRGVEENQTDVLFPMGDAQMFVIGRDVRYDDIEFYMMVKNASKHFQNTPPEPA